MPLIGWLALLGCFDYGVGGDPCEADPAACSCTIAPAAAITTDSRTECVPSVVPSPEPWKVTLLWEQPTRTGTECAALSAVVDGDGDGLPDVLCRTGDGVALLRGTDGLRLWTAGRPIVWPVVALDLDADGAVEIVGVDASRSGAVVRVDPTNGEVVWTSELPIAQLKPADGEPRVTSPGFQVADLWSDGGHQAVGQLGVLDLDTDTWLVRWELSPWSPSVQEVATVDLDGDGVEEVCGMGACRALDGRTWTFPQAISDMDVALAVTDSDADGLPEITWRSFGRSHEVEWDGVGDFDVVRDESDDGELLQSPCAGRGPDGQVVVDASAVGEVRGISMDRVAWSWQKHGAPLSGGCSAFDFDGDGVDEFVAGGADEPVVFGASGLLMVGPGDAPRTGIPEAPILVDLDGDGSIEIISALGGGVRVWSHPDGGWPPGSPIWPFRTWSGTGVSPDGRLEAAPDRPWETSGLWRGQPASPVLGTDLSTEVAASCVAPAVSPHAEVRLSVRVVNLGPERSVAGTPVAIYAADRRVLAVLHAETPLLPGQSTVGLEVVLPAADALGGIEAVAGDDGVNLVIDDCKLDNNVARWP